MAWKSGSRELNYATISKMVALRGLFHLGCGIFYAFGTYHDFQIVTVGTQSYGGRFKYLTVLNLVSLNDRWPGFVTPVSLLKSYMYNCEISQRWWFFEGFSI